MSPAPSSALDSSSSDDSPDPNSAEKPNYRQNKPRSTVPLPPPDAYAHPKEPELITHPPTPAPLQYSSSSQTSSPTVSDGECYSVPSSRPPSAAPSRHPSVSGEKPKIIAQPPTPLKSPRKSSDQPAPRAPSVHSDTGSSHKFNLKDLLASAGPKLTRRPSASSRKSDTSDGGGGAPKSVAGESTASFSQKYGVCGKVAVGKGATSVVRLAHKWDRSVEKLYAVKEFRKRRKNETEKEYIKKLTAEFCISSTLHHINVVETVDLIQDENAHWCEVMEFCPGGDLYAAIKKGGMSESEVECCFKQMLTGVQYLHGQGVAHRDLKPENMFFDSHGNLKIGDFGASTVYRLPWETSTHMSTGLCGSEPYIAPEQFLNKPYDARFVDIWACGIVYYCLHFQELPWRAAQPSEALYLAYSQACAASPLSPIPGREDVKKSRPSSPAATKQTAVTKEKSKDKEGPNTYPTTIHNLPRSARPLLRRILEPVPKLRFGIEDVMKDGWIQSIQVCSSMDKANHVHVCARAMSAQVGV